MFSVESHLHLILFGRINICTFISWRRTCSIYLQQSFIEIIILITMSLLENRIDIFWFANSINPIEIQSADWEKLLVFVWVFWPYFSLPVQPVEGEQDCYYYSHSWHFLETDLHLIRRNCGELRQRSGFLAVVVRLFVVY